MQVKDHLPGVRTGIDNQPVTGLVNPLLPGKLASDRKQPTDQQLVSFGQVVDRGNMPVGDHQDMCTGNGMDIPEGRDLFVLVKNLAGGFTHYNPAEYAGGIAWKISYAVVHVVG